MCAVKVMHSHIAATTKAKCISTFSFTTQYTGIPQNLLIRVFFFNHKILCLEGNLRNSLVIRIFCLPENYGSIRYFTKKSCIVLFLYKLLFILLEILDTNTTNAQWASPCWEDLFLHSYESKYIQSAMAKGARKRNEALFSKQIKRAFFGYSDAFNVITFLRDYLHDIYGHRLLGIHKYAKKNI